MTQAEMKADSGFQQLSPEAQAIVLSKATDAPVVMTTEPTGPGKSRVVRQDKYSAEPIWDSLSKVKEIRAGNPPWKHNVTNFSNDFFPMLGAGLAEIGVNAARLVGAPVPPSLDVAASGTGWATGKGLARDIKEVVGLREPGDERKLTNVEAVKRTATDIGEGAVGRLAGEFVGKTAGKVVDWYSKGKDYMGKAVSRYMKATRPPVAAGSSMTQIGQYSDDVATVLGDLTRNKNTLELVDKHGHTVTGKVPETYEQFAQSIPQGKNRIYQLYNTMMEKASGKGATVSLEPVAVRLESLANNSVTKTENPEIAKRTLDLAARLREQKQYTLPELQDAVKRINTKLEAYEKNPSAYESDYVHTLAEQARAYRDALDTAIESYEGPGYADLRKQYKAYKSIEEHVAKRLFSEKSKQKNNLDIYDIYSISTAIGGLTSGNPVGLARAAAVEGAKRTMNKLKDPNYLIKGAFKLIDKAINEENLAEQLAADKHFDASSPIRHRPPLLPSGVHAQTAGSPERMALPPPSDLGNPAPGKWDPYKRPGAREAGLETRGVEGTYPPQFARGHTPTLRELSKEETIAELGAMKRSAPRDIPGSTLSSMPPQSPAAERATTFEGPREMIRRSPAGQSAAVFEELFRQTKTPQQRQLLLSNLKGKQLAYYKKLAKEMDAAEKTEASSALVGRKD